ncbi:hypothetical protein D3C76_1069920 [compost metagenome]
MTNISGITDKLQQDTGNLVGPHQYVVWPLQAGISDTLLAQCLQHGQANHKAQPFQLTHTPLDS